MAELYKQEVRALNEYSKLTNLLERELSCIHNGSLKVVLQDRHAIQFNICEKYLNGNCLC